jgi:hypothetical protein
MVGARVPMVAIAAGRCRVGSDAHYPEERPSREVAVAAFLIGPGSTIVGRENHPVTHVALADALAYAQWRDACLAVGPCGRLRVRCGARLPHVWPLRTMCHRPGEMT